MACVYAGSAGWAQQGAASSGPLTPFQRHKAEALLRTRYPCLGCHELNGTGGHIGPSLTGVASRKTADAVYSMIEDPGREVPGTIMPRVSMPDATRRLIAAYLAGAWPSAIVAGPPPGRGTGPPALDAAALYSRWCAACHGAEGEGNGPNARFLDVPPTAHASAEVMGLRPDDSLFDTIFAGGFIMNLSPFMPPFGESLSRDDIWNLVRHIRALCRCEGPAWAEDQKLP